MIIRTIDDLKKWWIKYFPIRSEIKPRKWLNEYITYENGNIKKKK